MLFGIMRFAHFAHGDFLTLGAYIALPLVTYVGLHPILGAIGSALVVAVIAMSIDQICYKPLRLRSTIVLVMASLGVALMLRSVIQLTFGVEIFSYNPGVIIKPMQFDWLLIKSKDIWIIVASIILMFTIHCLLSYTKVGKAMRAMSDSVELAKLTGIPTEKIVKITWAVGGGLAAIAVSCMENPITNNVGLGSFVTNFCSNNFGRHRTSLWCNGGWLSNRIS